LCPTCNLPETDLVVKKDKKIYAVCKACGWRGLSDNTHKLATYIVNHPPNKDPKVAAAAGKPSKKEKRLAKIEKSKTKDNHTEDHAAAGETNGNAPEHDSNSGGDEEGDHNNENGDHEHDGEDHGDEKEDGEWEFEVTEEMQNVTATDHVELEDPVKEMAKVLKSHEKEASTVLVGKVKEYQKQKNFTDEETFQYVFKALVTDNMADQVKTNLALIKKLASPITRENQILVISLIEERCEANQENLKFVPPTLMELYEADVLEEETVTTWHTKGISQLVALADDKVARKVRKAADKFIDWLKTAEEESEEE